MTVADRPWPRQPQRQSPPRKHKRRPKRKRMTIAIAALCGWPNDVSIIAVADHMVTSGDVEFEQPQPKMWQLHTSCVAVFFGLSAAQGQIASRAEAWIASQRVVEIATVAEIYAFYLRDYVRREAEADLLAPLALKSADLVKEPPVVNATLIQQLSKQLQAYYDSSGLSDDLGGAIIAGVDGTGAHLYLIEHGKVRFMDSIGFVAAGGGQWHAESQFMFSRYTRGWEFPDALSLMYAAKKRAEVAPGVGPETDIVIITTKPPNVIHTRSDSDLVQGLESVYQEHKRKLDEDFASQHRAVKTFLTDLFAKAASNAPPPPPPPQPPVQPAQLPPGDVPLVTSVCDEPPLTTPKSPKRRRKASLARRVRRGSRRGVVGPFAIRSIHSMVPEACDTKACLSGLKKRPQPQDSRFHTALAQCGGDVLHRRLATCGSEPKLYCCRQSLAE